MGILSWLFGGKKKDDEFNRYQKNTQRNSNYSQRKSNHSQNNSNPKCTTCSSHVYKKEHTQCYSCWRKANPKPKKERGTPPSTIKSYNRIIKMVSISSGQDPNLLTEDNFKEILCNKYNFQEDSVKGIINSPIARSMLQWD